ncbi:MAG: leucine dehydrogenase, partial [Bdellovibrionales bacterium]|nr:leucine dehydrogenase [Bdellovibrionales bacterium]
DLNLGGGKAVIIGDPEKDKSPQLFKSFGLYVSSLGGRYITAKDAGVTTEDLQKISQGTPYVIGRPESYGGVGDPSRSTALGVYYGILSAVKWKLKKDSLENLKISVQGAGSVGFALIEHLVKEKAEVYVSDVKDTILDRVKKSFPSIKIVEPDKILSIPCDVFSPCALGGVIDGTALDIMDCSIIAGGANNVLSTSSMAEKAKDRKLLYVPDFIINSGGLIYVFAGLPPLKSSEWIENKIKGIYNTLTRIFQMSEEQDITTGECAFLLSEERMDDVDPSSFYLGGSKNGG